MIALRLIVVASILSFTGSVFARYHWDPNYHENQQQQQQQGQNQPPAARQQDGWPPENISPAEASAAIAEASSSLPTSDSDLITAYAGEKNCDFVAAGNLVVVDVLPDDTEGLPHQRWKAKMSNGQIVMIIYNLNMGPHVPLQIGDSFEVAGQFIWTGNSEPLVHWTHIDPEHRRENGYVHHKGNFYGLSGPKN